MEKRYKQMTLEELMQDAQRLRSELSANIRAQQQIKSFDFIAKYGFDIGNKVQWHDGKNYVQGVICSIDSTGYQPYYFANPFKGNGKLSKIEKRIWNPETLQRIDDK